MIQSNKLVKQIAVFMLTAGFLIACHPAENKEAKSQTEQAVKTDADHEHDHEAASELSLNNGAKWKADSSTNKNVSELYNLISDANLVMLEDYQKTAKTLQVAINKMVSDCRMQGADHEALHHWLEPLMEMNKKMQDVKLADEGKEVFTMIRKQISLYPQFFE